MKTVTKTETNIEIKNALFSAEALAQRVNRYTNADAQVMKQKQGQAIALKFYQRYDAHNPDLRQLAYANFIVEKGQTLKSFPDMKSQGDVYSPVVASVTTQQIHDLFGKSSKEITKGLEEIKAKSTTPEEMLGYFF